MLSPASRIDGHWPGDIFAVQWPVSQPLVGSVVFSKLSCLSLLGISILLCYFRSASMWVAGLPVALWSIISGASSLPDLLTF